jgi:hypothetical protein
LFLGPEIDFFPPLKFIIMQGNGRRALAKEDRINLIARAPNGFLGWGQGERARQQKPIDLAWASENK